MYDVNAPCEYETDEEYRACLLAFFGMTEYSDAMLREIQLLTSNEALKAAATALDSDLPLDLAFLLLFSFDHFKQTHNLLSLHKANAGDQREREAVQEPAVVGIEIPAQVP